MTLGVEAGPASATAELPLVERQESADFLERERVSVLAVGAPRPEE
jgi:hypothetical protein